ncbi:hypothetical protein ACWD4G_31220 [Streptomyces sp. NPDC002643]
MKKKHSSMLAAMGMAACFTLGLQGTANAASTGHASVSGDVSIMAWPTGCSNGKYGEGWEAQCRNSNGGHYKATVTCSPDSGGKAIVRYPSVWKSKGLSIVHCPPLTFVVGGGIITKAS